MAEIIHVSLAQTTSIINALAEKIKAKGYMAEADLGALAKKSAVEKTDLAEALATEINGAVSQAETNRTAIETLNGTGADSVSGKIDAAFNDFGAKISDDNMVNTYKELIDYAAENGSEMATLTGKMSTMETDLSNKVDKDGNKVLSDENYTTEEKEKLASIRLATDEELAEVINGLSLD